MKKLILDEMEVCSDVVVGGSNCLGRPVSGRDRRFDIFTGSLRIGIKRILLAREDLFASNICTLLLPNRVHA